jgi:HD-GYP domain-containing protein (c-di-GMP phosphodiesterase class II)
MKALRADRSEFFRYDPERRDLAFELGVGYPEGTEGATRSLTFALGEERGVVGQVALARTPVCLRDVQADPRWISVDPEIRSGLWVPAEHEDRLLGVLSVLSERTGAFSQQDERLLLLFANQAAVALENARLFEETRRRADQLLVLNRISSALSQTLDLDQLLEVIYREVRATLHADAFLIALYDIATDELNYRIRLDEEVREPPERRPLSSGLTELVIRSKKPLMVRDREQEKDRYPPVKVWGIMKAPRARLNVPMLFRDTVVGMISLQSYQAYAFGEEEERLLSTIADQAAVAVEKAGLFTKTEHRLQRLHALSDIDKAIRSSFDLSFILDVVLDQVTRQLRVAADILLHNPRTQTLSYAAGLGFQSRALQYTELRLGEGLAGTAALERRIVHYPDLTREANGLRRSLVLANEGFIAYFVIPLISKGQTKGVLEIFHRAPMEPDQEWFDFAKALASQAAIAIDGAELYQDLQRTNAELILAYDATIEGWSRALELRDRETEGHTARVTELTVRLAQKMGISAQGLVYIRHSALLHDIGKLAVPDSILFKPGPLNEEEWEVMHRHPTHAYKMLSPIAYLHQALDVPYGHHERWDGTGYPRGLIGEQIPLAARIFAVIDVWDALRSDCPYRTAWSEDQVYACIRDQAGKHFDPRVVEEFLKIDTTTR